MRKAQFVMFAWTYSFKTPHQVNPTHTHERREEADEGGEEDGGDVGPNSTGHGPGGPESLNRAGPSSGR